MLTKIQSMLINTVNAKKSSVRSSNLDYMQPVLFAMEESKTFLMSLVAIFSKLGRIDGKINQDEIKGLYDLFAHSGIIEQVYQYFVDSLEDYSSVDTYIKKILLSYRNIPELNYSLVIALFHYSAVDGPINYYELNLLRKIINSFGMDSNKIPNLIHMAMTPRTDDPHIILKVSHNPSRSVLKNAYYTAIKRYHTDYNKNIPQEVVHYANHYVSLLNKGYKVIKNDMGFK